MNSPKNLRVHMVLNEIDLLILEKIKEDYGLANIPQAIRHSFRSFDRYRKIVESIKR